MPPRVETPLAPDNGADQLLAAWGDVKLKCPHCEIEMVCPTSVVGRPTNCPSCAKSISIPSIEFFGELATLHSANAHHYREMAKWWLRFWFTSLPVIVSGLAAGLIDSTTLFWPFALVGFLSSIAGFFCLVRFILSLKRCGFAVGKFKKSLKSQSLDDVNLKIQLDLVDKGERWTRLQTVPWLQRLFK